jgi:LysR family glycine cleavage system transcriptional activator
MPAELPSLTALQAFEAAARLSSFTRAAEELHRTQGAISRQVALLEGALGVPLFRREHPHVRPTPAAQVFAAKVRGILERLAAVCLEVEVARGEGGVLNLAILPTFGTRWLIPRIGSFYARHPDISIHLTTRIQTFDFESVELDAAIHHGDALWPGALLERLMEDRVLAVCTPKLRDEARLSEPADLARQTLLQMESRLGAWNEWFEALGVRGVDGRRGPRFEHHLMVIQAALAGLGVALLPDFLVREELEQGSLVAPIAGEALATGRAYFLAYPPRSADLPALGAFRSWLREGLRAEGLAPVSMP